ncbi:hypothetical protein ACWIGI_07580 [Nocardia sp. NPDC055321]
MRRVQRIGSGAAALAVLIMPAVLAPSATADITSVEAVGEHILSGPACNEVGCDYNLIAFTAPNANDPVSFYINGVFVQTVQRDAGPYGGTVVARWVPDHAGVYTLTATQGESTKSKTFRVVDGDGEPNPQPEQTGSF